MSEIIRKGDISEKDIYGWVIESGKMATTVINTLNEELKESARLSREAIGKNKSAGNVNEIKALEQALKDVNKQYVLKQKLEAERITVQTRLNRAIRLESEETERSIRADQKKAKAQSDLQSSYQRVNIWLNNLRREYRDLATVQNLGGKLDDAQIKRLGVLEGRIKTFDNTLKNVDANMGIHNRNVGNYASATAGLGFSFAQITREAPAFANSLNTGFMAISNNLPILVDSIQNLIRVNKELAAQGKPTQSVFKSLAGAVFSFQTALSLGVTLLTIFGKQIIDAFTGAGLAAVKQEALNKALEEGNRLTDKYTNSLENLQAWDKISREEAIKRVESTIKRTNALKEETKTELYKNKVLQNQRGFIKNLFSVEDEIAKGRQVNLEVELSNQNAVLTKLYEYLNQLKLEEYQEQKAEKSKKKITKAVKENTEAYEEYMRVRKDLSEIEDPERSGFSDVEAAEDAVRRRRRTAAELNVIEARLSKDQEKIREARINQILEESEVLKEEAFGNAIEIEKIEKETQLKLMEIDNEIQKEKFENRKKWIDLALDYEIEKSEKRIEQLEKESQAAQKQYDYLTELAKNGNISAKQSLSEQEKIINDANKRKEAEQRRIERLKLFETGLGIYGQKVETGDPKPLLNTLKDLTLLKQGINALLPTFFDGIENTGPRGRGVDGKGGFNAILHPYERVVPAKDNAKIPAGMDNSSLANLANDFATGKVVHVNKKDSAGSTWDLLPLIGKIDELKTELKNQARDTTFIGEVLADSFQLITEQKKGNNINRTIRKIRR